MASSAVDSLVLAAQAFVSAPASADGAALLKQLSAAADALGRYVSGGGAQPGASIEQALGALTPAAEANTLAILFLLDAQASAAGVDPARWLDAACHLLLSADARQVKTSPEKFASLCHRVRDACLKLGVPGRGLAPLARAVRSIRPTPGCLTPQHGDLFHLSLAASNLAAALPLLENPEEEVLEVNPPATGSAPQDFPLYCLHGGTCLAAGKRFGPAAALLSRACCAPATALSAIVLACHKRGVLCALLARPEGGAAAAASAASVAAASASAAAAAAGAPSAGPPPPPPLLSTTVPKHASPAVARGVRSHCGAALGDVEKAFLGCARRGGGGPIGAELTKALATHEAALRSDGLWGLAKQLKAEGQPRRCAAAAAATYATAPLHRLAQDCGLTGGGGGGGAAAEAEAEALLFRLASRGVLATTVDQRAGFAAFPPPAAAAAAAAAALQAACDDARRLAAAARCLDEAMQLEPAAIARAIALERNAAQPGGAGGGAGAGAGAGGAAAAEADLMAAAAAGGLGGGGGGGGRASGGFGAAVGPVGRGGDYEEEEDEEME